MQWLNFIIIMQITNNVFIAFSTMRFLLGTNTFSVSTSKLPTSASTLHLSFYLEVTCNLN